MHIYGTCNERQQATHREKMCINENKNVEHKRGTIKNYEGNVLMQRRNCALKKKPSNFSIAEQSACTNCQIEYTEDKEINYIERSNVCLE